MYLIKEIFHSRQGEGFHTGKDAVFVRFSGCNLWNGKEEDRKDSICQFCDTDFVGVDGENGGRYDTQGMVRVICDVRRTTNHELRTVILTGGEPLLQVDDELITELHKHGFFIAIETNGTRPIPKGIDWVCVSPKMGADLVVRTGDELKLVYPQEGIDPNEYLKLNFSHFFLQPKDGDNVKDNIKLCTGYCYTHPGWKVSKQMQKEWGIR